ncbi:TlpA family protein disulfide reductase [Neomegalonema perideroedes]|uniref:TlpA family protein disulfide reductase n=1 Tax=Neomegalonema perideroedes TaxID=217219 RepID=UPI00035C9F4E|nr:TlpA disulfide reductase family protein [Neomegalonema perideroedes]
MNRFLKGAALALGLALTAAAPGAAQVVPGLSSEAALWAAQHVQPGPQGLTAPDFPILHAADGRKGSLADYKGRVAVVTLWKSDCPICRREMPVIDRMAAEMAPEGLVMAPLTLDLDLDRARFAFEGWGVRSLPVIQDLERINGTFFALSVHQSMSISTPTTYVLDKSGVIRGVVWGAGDWEAPGAKAWLRALMAESV